MSAPTAGRREGPARGVGTIVLAVRRGDGPPGAADYTFPALVAREELITHQPQAVAGAIGARVGD
jgi:hypothetical protein